MRARCWALSLVLLAALTLPRIAAAHPMGNFSVNHYSKITLLDDRVAIRYLIDLAEIPTFQELQAGNITAQAGDTASIQYVAGRGEQLGRGLSLIIDGKQIPLRMVSSDVIFPPG